LNQKLRRRPIARPRFPIIFSLITVFLELYIQLYKTACSICDSNEFTVQGLSAVIARLYRTIGFQHGFLQIRNIISLLTHPEKSLLFPSRLWREGAFQSS
jgi:hypothetical protein